MRSLFGLNLIHLVILGYAHLWSVMAGESTDLGKSLQSDQLWRDHPSEAVRSLEMLLKQEPQLALSILIQRYDGWSEIGLKDPAGGRPKEPYTLYPLVKKLDQREVEQLYELLATKDFYLTEMQGLRLRLGTASCYRPKFEVAQNEHIKEVAKNRAFTPRQVRRLEEALGVYPISSELAKELEDDTLWQKQPELAVKRLENLFEVHPSMGVMILLTKFCRHASSDKSGDPAQLDPLRAYSFVPFIEKLTPRRNLETLFNLMAIRDFELSDQQVIQLRRAVSARYPNPAAFLNHVAEYLDLEKYGYLPEHRKRLERQLGITLPPKRD